MQLWMTIERIMSAEPDRHASEKIIQTCYRYAVGYLRQKIRRGNLQPDRFGMSLEDLALDSIADLFERDAAGRFMRLADYLETISWHTLSQEDLEIGLRRFVFSKVNEGLFRRYREADPVLAKIIRNIKANIGRKGIAHLERRQNRWWIVVGEENGSHQFLPMAPPEVLQAFLVSYLRRSSSIQSAIDGFIDFVRVHPHYCNSYALVGFAQAVRWALCRVGYDEYIGRDGEECELFRAAEVRQAIHRTIREVAAEKRQTYLKESKVDQQTYSAYFKAVGDILAAEFVNDAAPVESFYDALTVYLPGLTRNGYRYEHRNRLEYLAKLSRVVLIQNLRQSYIA